MPISFSPSHRYQQLHVIKKLASVRCSTVIQSKQCNISCFHEREILCLTGFSTLTDTWESSWVPEVLQTDEQGATSMTQEPLLNTQKNISRLDDLYVFMHAFSTPPFSFLSGRVPLQYPWLWLDRGWLHSWGPEVSDAAAGALSLHRPVCHLRAPLWCRQCGEINVTNKRKLHTYMN